ncbi:unnamed protein product, partial [Nesidiocoris tenuis]
MELLRHLALRNDFGFHRDHIQRVETIRLAPSEQVSTYLLLTYQVSKVPSSRKRSVLEI